MIQIDFNTTEGARLKTALEARLDELRRTNDTLGMDPTSTAELRGRIAEIRALLQGKVPHVAPHPGYGIFREGRGY